MSWLEFVYSLALLGMGFVLGWGLHLFKTEDEMEAVIEDIEELETTKGNLNMQSMKYPH